MTKMFENAVQKTKMGQVIPCSYDMSLEDMQELLKLGCSGNRELILIAITTAFRFGFVMGNRATHSRNMRRL